MNIKEKWAELKEKGLSDAEAALEVEKYIESENVRYFKERGIEFPKIGGVQ